MQSEGKRLVLFVSNEEILEALAEVQAIATALNRKTSDLMFAYNRV